MNPVIGIDLSGPSTGWKVVPREWFADVRTSHPEIRVVCVGLWTGGRRYDNAYGTLLNARLEGFITSAYYVVHDHLAPEYHFSQAVSAAGVEYHNLAFLSVDVEKPDEAWEVSMATIDRSCELVEMYGQRAPVYSSGYMWEQLGLGLMTYRRKAWNAYYDGNPDIDFEKYPWGGTVLGDLIGEQYTGSTPLFGIEVDFNVFDLTYLEEKAPMTEQEKKDIDAKFEGMRVLFFEAFQQINDTRDRVNGTVAGLKEVRDGLASLADLVHNSVGGGPQQTGETKAALANLQQITDKLIADREKDGAAIVAAGKLLAGLTE